MVTRERPAAGIGAMHAGGESNDATACCLVAESGYWPGKVTRIVAANIGKKAGQALALNAIGIK